MSNHKVMVPVLVVDPEEEMVMDLAVEGQRKEDEVIEVCSV